ncbi:hypothetical protein QT22_00575, partial [Staphylococcus aureus]
RGEVADRLVAERHLPVLDRPAQLGLDAELLAGDIEGVGLIDFGAAALLCPLHRELGVAHQVLGIAVIVGAQRDADGAVDADLEVG